MKKFLVLIFAFVLALGVFVGCDNDDYVDIYVPDGAPALSLVSIFDRTEIAGQKVRFTVVPSANIMTYLTSKNADLAIVPTNAASIIYNKDNPYKYVSANTHGNLFMVGTEATQDLEELKGKVVGVMMKGQVPDLVFRTVLEQNNIEYEVGEAPIEGKVTLRYVQDGSEILILIKEGVLKYGILGEPAVTTAINNIDGAQIAFDFQELWGGGYPQAGLMAKNSVSDEFIKAFFDELEKDETFALDNPNDALDRIKAKMISSSETTIKYLNEQIIENCNVKLVKAENCKDDVIKLLTAFNKLEPSSIGGKLPDDNFFRIVK